MKRNKVCDTPNNIMNLKTFAQSERSQAQRGTQCIIPFIEDARKGKTSLCHREQGSGFSGQGKGWEGMTHNCLTERFGVTKELCVSTVLVIT